MEKFEDQRLMENIFLNAPQGGVIKVVIGDESHVDALRPFSMVISRYGVPGQVTGVVGALGPTRMEYIKTLSAVCYVSRLMGEMVQGVYGN